MDFISPGTSEAQPGKHSAVTLFHKEHWRYPVLIFGILFFLLVHYAVFASYPDTHYASRAVFLSFALLVDIGVSAFSFNTLAVSPGDPHSRGYPPIARLAYTFFHNFGQVFIALIILYPLMNVIFIILMMNMG